MSTVYADFIMSKKIQHKSAGIDVSREVLASGLFDFQKDLVQWALKKGRAALFTATGTGKSMMQSEWANQVANHTGGNVLILAPLAVSRQTVDEAAKIGVAINLCRKSDDVKPGVNITNYEMLHHFDHAVFDGVVLDESSILKSFAGKYRQLITESFEQTPFRLSASATPAPNDYMEFGTQAEFLGVLSRSEMLSCFFIHDGGDTSKWRLKGHGKHKFWEWLASWAAVLEKPSDLGYENGAYDLPELRIHEEMILSDTPQEGCLFVAEARNLAEQRAARRQTLADRVAKCAEIVNHSSGQFLVWCNMNDESSMLTKSIEGAVEVTGSDHNDHKERSMLDFAAGKIRVLVSKPSICGMGMNFQSCSQMAFVGLSHSFEQYYQAVRRCWRFGQDRPVDVYIITSDLEGAVKANVLRKEQDAERMIGEMVGYTRDLMQREVRQTVREVSLYEPEKTMRIPAWLKEGMNYAS